MENDDLPPELEDLSDELNKIRNTRGQKDDEDGEIKVKVVNEVQNNKVQPQVKAVQNKPNDEEFGSFLKRGFLKRPNNSNNSQNKAVDLTHIKSTSQNNNKAVEEIKSEIKSNRENVSGQYSNSVLNNIVEKKDEWMNQDLLTKIAQKPNLMKYFMDPRFTEIITIMQKDPQKAIAQYGHVKEFSEFIKEFSEIMADHFGKIGKEKEKEELYKNPQFDKETQEILNDPQIKPIIYKLQTEGKLDVEEIQRDPNLAAKIKFLIDKGLFRIQKESELNK